MRYIWNKYRVIGSRNNILFNWRAIDNTALGFGLPEPIDERNLAAGYIYTISPTLINEFQAGYQRRNDTIYPVTANQGWAAILGIPGVGPQTFPGFIGSGSSSFNWTANPGGGSRTINEDMILADNVTKVHGRAYVEVRLSIDPPAGERYRCIAAIRHLYVSVQPQRQSTYSQYRQFAGDVRPGSRIGGEFHATCSPTICPTGPCTSSMPRIIGGFAAI